MAKSKSRKKKVPQRVVALPRTCRILQGHSRSEVTLLVGIPRAEVDEVIRVVTAVV